jgi:predicted DNA-binding transcriptional regulator AlpA
VLTWARWFETAERTVASDHVGDVHVSTVFLALDHNFGLEGPPVLWETMIFGGELDQEFAGATRRVRRRSPGTQQPSTWRSNAPRRFGAVAPRKRRAPAPAICPHCGQRHDERILTTSEVLARIPINRSTLWRMSQSGRFPPPIQISPARVGWRLSAVLDWIDERERKPAKSRCYFGRE